MTIELDARIYETDLDGYLKDFNGWNKNVAEYIAREEGIEMSGAHWEVIYFLRGYYDEYSISPMIRILTRAIGKKLGKEKGTTRYLYELYPDGPAKQACKIGGLPKPTGCG